MEYKVRVTYTVWDVYEVEADSVAEAYEKAEEMACNTSMNEMNGEFEGCTLVNF